MERKKNDNLRFIGKTKKVMSQFGEFFKILIDNPNKLKADGSPNTFHKGFLLWFDEETGKYYKVKSMGIKNCSDSAKQNDFINSVTIDLGDTYSVEELQS